MYAPDQLVKLTHLGGYTMNNFQYRQGLNEDKYPLNPQQCSQGGLCFCRFKDVEKWAYSYDGRVLIWKVDVPEGEEVVEYANSLKARRIILSEPRRMDRDGNIARSIEHDGLVKNVRHYFKSWLGL